MMTILKSLITALAVTICSHATEKPLHFDEAVALILKRSTSVGIQQTNAEAAQAQKLSAALAFAPTLSVNGKESANKHGSGGPAATSRQAEGTVNLNLLRFGADISNLFAADAQAQSQERLVEARVLSVEDTAVRALVESIQRRKEVDIYQHIADSQQELLLIAQQRYARGVLPMQEVDKLAIDLANSQARVKDAGIREAEAKYVLINLLGDADVEAEWPWEQRLKDSKTNATLAAPYSETKIPTWNAAKARLDAQENLTNRNFRLLFPSVDASFSYGYYKNQFLNYDQPGWAGTLSFSWPIFDGLKDYTSYRVQVYARESASLGLEQAARDARSNWDTSKTSFEISLATAIARDRTLSLSRKVYQGNYTRFKAGSMSANELFIDRSRLFESELLTVQGWGAAHVAYMQLYHAVGQRVVAQPLTTNQK